MSLLSCSDNTDSLDYKSVDTDEAKQAEIDSNNETTSNNYLPLTAYISSSGNIGATEKIEATKQYIQLEVKDIPEPEIIDRDFTIMQKQYRGTYVRKKISAFETLTYVYTTEDNTQISVDSTGRVVDVLLPEHFTHYVDYANPEEMLTADEYVRFATNHLINIFGKDTAARYTAKLPSLILTNVDVEFIANDVKSNTFNTFDSILIRLDECGNLLGYNAEYAGVYESKVMPNDLTDTDIKDMINASLTKNNNVIQISSKKNLIILSDGRMACYTSFRLIDGGTAGEWTSVLIPLE